LGGPKKKRSISKMAKKRKKIEKKLQITQKTIRDAVLSDEIFRSMMKEVPKMKYITPYVIASKYNLRLSLAKNMLREMKNNGQLILIASNRRAPLYAPVKKT